MSDSKIVSIDAIKYDASWEYNNIYYTGESINLNVYNTTRKILKRLRELNLLTKYSKGKVKIKDYDDYLIIIDKNTYQPLYEIKIDIE